MEHEKYIALLTVLDGSSISGAAKKLGYTTSGISRMIQSLEDENQLFPFASEWSSSITEAMNKLAKQLQYQSPGEGTK